MKKRFFLPLFIFVACSFSSCEDDSTNPLPEKVAGQYMKLDIQTRQMRFADISNTAFTGVLSNPSNNVVKYELNVRRKDGSGFLTSDYVPLMTITSFPYELRITPQMIADAYGLQLADLQDGDVYTFFGYSYDAAGRKAGYINLTRAIQVTASMEQGYKFNTNLVRDANIITDELDPYNNHQANP